MQGICCDGDTIIDVTKLNDAQLRQHLTDFGANIGPVNNATRNVYRRKLERWLRNAPSNCDIDEVSDIGPVKKSNPVPRDASPPKQRDRTPPAKCTSSFERDMPRQRSVSRDSSRRRVREMTPEMAAEERRAKRQESPGAKRQESPGAKRQESPGAKRKESPCAKMQESPGSKRQESPVSKRHESPNAVKTSSPITKKRYVLPLQKKPDTPLPATKKDKIEMSKSQAMEPLNAAVMDDKFADFEDWSEINGSSDEELIAAAKRIDVSVGAANVASNDAPFTAGTFRDFTKTNSCEPGSLHRRPLSTYTLGQDKGNTMRGDQDYPAVRCPSSPPGGATKLPPNAAKPKSPSNPSLGFLGKPIWVKVMCTAIFLIITFVIIVNMEPGFQNPAHSG